MPITVPVEAITPVTPFVVPCVHSTLVRWHWHCPTCGSHVVAYWAEHVTPETIAQDARCGRCRQDGRTT